MIDTTLGKELCLALELDPNKVRSIALVHRAGHIPIAVVTMVIKDDVGDRIRTAVSRYKLHAK